LMSVVQTLFITFRSLAACTKTGSQTSILYQKVHKTIFREKTTGSKNSMSPIFSPLVITLTGMPRSFFMLSTIPPLEVPSVFVSMTPLTSMESEKISAWFLAFCPVVESIARSTSSGGLPSFYLLLSLSSLAPASDYMKSASCRQYRLSRYLPV